MDNQNQNPHPEFDSSRTGTVESGTGIWWRMNKKDGYFSRGDRKVNGFKGFLSGFDIVYDTGNGDKVAPCWKLKLTLWVSGEEWNFDVSGLYQDAVGNILNVLCATTALWDRWMKISLYKKDDAQLSSRLSAWTEDTDAKSQKLLCPWNGSNGYIGVPESIEYKGAPGTKSTFDHTPERRFWLEKAVEFYERFHGRKYEGDAVKLYHDYLASLGVATASPQGAQAQNAPATTKDAKGFRDRLAGLMKDAKNEADFNNIVAAAYPKIGEYGISPENFRATLIMHVTTVLGANWTVNEKMMPVQNMPTEIDPLPF
jgi:hypothetical protein